MPIPSKIVKTLEKANIKYEPINHRTVYTAYDKAATLKALPKIIGKTLVMRLDKTAALIVIPANKHLDIQKLKKLTKTKNISFIKEPWMKKNLKGVKIGAVPPLGGPWRLLTVADRALLNQSKIIINSGDHSWSIKITPGNFKKLIPDLVVGVFTKPKK